MAEIDFKEKFIQTGTVAVQDLLNNFSKGLVKEFQLFEFNLEKDISKYRDDKYFNDYLEGCRENIREQYSDSLKIYISKQFFKNGKFCFFVIAVYKKKLGTIKNKLFFEVCFSVILDKLREDFRNMNLDFYTFDYLPSIYRNATNNLLESISYKLTGKKSIYLFSLIEQLSILTYEKSKTSGLIYFFGEKEISTVKFQFMFKKKIALVNDNLLLIRKVLELSNPQTKVGLVSDTRFIYGLAVLTNKDVLYRIEFRQNNTWELLQDTTSVIQVKNSQPILKSDNAIKKEFENTYRRVFGAENTTALRNLSKCIMTLLRENKGAIIVISENAKEIIEKYKDLSIEIEPKYINENNIVKLSSIDGAIIIDEQSLCYGFGAILDGLDTGNGDSARGARYNSSERFYSLYTKSKEKMLVFVLSDDGNYDIFPSINFREQIIKYLSTHVSALFQDLLDCTNIASPKIIRMILNKLISHGAVGYFIKDDGTREYFLLNE